MRTFRLSILFALLSFVAVPLLAAVVIATSAMAQVRNIEQQPFREDIFRVGMPIEVTLCHIPPGNPTNAHTIQVVQAAVPAHLRHGDVLGNCPYECTDYPSSLPQSGLTDCWDPYGAPIECAGTGQDGEFQRGMPFPSPRFTDNLDGTATDNMTGLIWLKDANCFGVPTWQEALSVANTLASGSCGLTDGSSVGDWRLPNVIELHSLVDYGSVFPALSTDHPFSGVQDSNYWSSTHYVAPARHAWCVSLKFGGIYLADTDPSVLRAVWPVRGPE